MAETFSNYSQEEEIRRLLAKDAPTGGFNDNPRGVPQERIQPIKVALMAVREALANTRNRADNRGVLTDRERTDLAKDILDTFPVSAPGARAAIEQLIKACADRFEATGNLNDVTEIVRETPVGIAKRVPDEPRNPDSGEDAGALVDRILNRNR